MRYLDLTVLGSTIRVPIACPCIAEEEAVRAKRIDDEERRQRVRRLFNIAALGPVFSTCTFETWETRVGAQDMHDAALQYATAFNSQRGGLLFYGPPGNGKTHLATAVCNYLIPQGYSCVFRKTPVLLKAMTRANRSDAKVDDSEYYETLRQADLVVLDDLGAEKWTESREEALFLIVDDRYMWQKPLICTTNCGLDDLERHIGARTFDRLVEMCVLFENTGSSFRREKAAKRIATLRAPKKGGELDG